MRDISPSTRLLTALGTGKYDQRTFRIGTDPGAEGHRTRYSPVAISALCRGIRHASVLVTPEARETHLGPLTSELAALSITTEAVDIPPGRNEEELWAIFDILRSAIPGNEHLHVDVTHGYRHLPLFLFATAAYLSAGGSRIESVQYGLYENPDRSTVQLVDLAPLLTLLDGFYAARSFATTGDARPLARLLRQINDALFRAHRGDRLFSMLANSIDKLGESLALGLPLETGLRADRALSNLHALRENQVPSSRSSLGEALLVEIEPSLAVLARGAETATKVELPLSQDGLMRELKVAKFHARAGSHDRALLLLREWILSRCLMAGGQERDWLDYDGTRSLAERRLNCLTERRRAGAPMLPGQKELVSLWQRVTRHRNHLAHAGMRPDEIDIDGSKVLALIEECHDNAGDDDRWNAFMIPKGDRVLLAPLGTSPGALHTLLREDPPDRALVITGSDAESRLDEILSRSGFDRKRIAVYPTADPHRAFSESVGFKKWLTPHLARADTVVGCLTGGTTALGHLVETGLRAAEQLGLEVRRIALVTAATGNADDPWARGEVIEITDP